MTTELSRRLSEVLFELDSEHWDDPEAHRHWRRTPFVFKTLEWKFLSKEEQEKLKPIETVDLEQLVRDCNICMAWLSDRLNSWEIYDYAISMTGVHVNDGHK
tara:strand:+ start:1834 stop:2139 length:306 start_codon:yes stop_codon:yes gene_type:complete